MELHTMRKFLELMTMSLASFIRKVNRKGVQMNNYNLFLKNFINHTRHVFIILIFIFMKKKKNNNYIKKKKMLLILKVTCSSTPTYTK